MNNSSRVVHLFHEKDVCITCTDRPYYNNAWGAENTTYGIECHKDDLEYVKSQLERLGIQYTIHEARFVNTKGCLTHKAFKFLEIPNHEKAYEIIANGGIA